MYLISLSVQLCFSSPSLLNPARRKINLWSCSTCQLLHLGPEHPPHCSHQQFLLFPYYLPVNQLHEGADEEGSLSLPPTASGAP